MKKSILFILIIFMIAMGNMPISANYQTIPSDYTRVTHDKNYIFVMLSPYEGGQNPEVRAKYNQSGLYHLHDNTTPIWTISWYARRVHLSRNGKYLARLEPEVKLFKYNELAIGFYENGELLKQYVANDLIALPILLPYRDPPDYWIKSENHNFPIYELNIKTTTGRKYTFDMKTGNIIEGELPDGTSRTNLQLSGIGILFLLLLGVVTWLWRSGPNSK